MTTNFDSAYILITEELKTYWAAGAGALVGGPVPEIRYYGNEKGEIPKTYFIRFHMQEVTSRQSSFRQTDGKRYANVGNIIIQAFAPRGDRQAYQRMRAMTAYLQARFRKHIDCISFTHVRRVDLDPEPNFLRQTMVAVYRYDEIQA